MHEFGSVQEAVTKLRQIQPAPRRVRIRLGRMRGSAKGFEEMFREYKADGVIHYGLQFCQPYITESMPVEGALEEKNIPTLRIETDYSMEDVGQAKTRVEAFIEQIK